MTVSPDAAAAATNRHYDQSPDLFGLFLGRRMKYTSGLYRDGTESLDEAQEAKLRFVARLLRLRGGERVLDVGSGWGSMALFLAENLGCDVVGVTPSPRQTRFIRDRAAAAGVSGRVQIDCSSIYDTDLSGQSFDAATLVGVIEAMPSLVPVLRKVAAHLKPSGRVYLSAACYRSGEMFGQYVTRPASRHVSEDIFGYGVLRPLSALIGGFEEARLSMVGCYDLTEHYRRTIDQWIERIVARRAEMDARYPGQADEFLRYFATSNAGWGYTTKFYGLVAMRSRLGHADMVG